MRPDCKSHQHTKATEQKKKRKKKTSCHPELKCFVDSKEKLALFSWWGLGIGKKLGSSVKMTVLVQGGKAALRREVSEPIFGADGSALELKRQRRGSKIWQDILKIITKGMGIILQKGSRIFYGRWGKKVRFWQYLWVVASH